MLLDAAVLLGVPTLLYAVYTLPDAVRRRMLFDYRDPTLLTAYTSHFVHLRVEHLAANVVGFLLVAAVGYGLCRSAGRTRSFRIASATFLTALPLVLSGLNLALFRPRISFGFSGISMAFFGFIPYALATYVDVTRAQRDGHVAPMLFFASLAVVALVAVPFGVVSAGLGAGCLCVAGVYGVQSQLTVRRIRRLPAKLLHSNGPVPLVVSGVALVLVYPLAAFPGDPTVDGGVLNLYSHLLGFCMGFVPSYVMALLGVFDLRVGR